MALLSRVAYVAALLVGGCYAPDFRDCAVSCSSPVSCAAGEVCGADGFCSAPETAGHCGHVDAGMITVHITIGGKGQVSLNHVSTCSSEGDQNGDCTFSIPSHTATTLTAITFPGHPFMAWTGQACMGTAPQCALVPTTSVAIGAVFK